MMKTLIILLSLSFLLATDINAQAEFVLDPSQSMIMTGKGPGQDATINPFYDQECTAVVKNKGQLAFSIRIQKDRKVIEEIPIQKGETKKIRLQKDYELYLDPNPTGITKASVDYEEIEE